MSWVRVWIHAVFTTKNRAPLIQRKYKEVILSHIKENAKEKGIMLLEVDGSNDHLHCLISLNKDMSLSKILQLIKGESSFWINKNNYCSEKFAWQDDYWAVGVSESHLHYVKLYIRNQEKHHNKSSFKEEVDLFMKKYGWTWQEK
jgi:REP element-mobilizing transposase RayT